MDSPLTRIINLYSDLTLELGLIITSLNFADYGKANGQVAKTTKNRAQKGC